jgi:hypothetical protein
MKVKKDAFEDRMTKYRKLAAVDIPSLASYIHKRIKPYLNSFITADDIKLYIKQFYKTDARRKQDDWRKGTVWDKNNPDNDEAHQE